MEPHVISNIVVVLIVLAGFGIAAFVRRNRMWSEALRELDYVKAAQALGVSRLRIVVRHILPNLLHLAMQ